MTASLIERLEGGEVGSRELDALVTVALKLDCKPNLPDDLHSLRAIRKDDHCAEGTYWFVQRSGMSLRTSEPVTTSLDAALSLAERVLPGWGIDLGYPCRLGEHGGRPWASVWPPNDDGEQPERSTLWGRGNPANATALPLALCAAILRAKEQAS